MKKWTMMLLIMVLAALLLAGCGCDHEWEEADCNDPKTCAKCGVVEGEELGHDYVDANCESPKTCSRCGKEKGDALGHTWVDATCAAPMTCSVCGATEGEALPHNWQDADCENPKTCADCGATEGEAAGHQWLSSVECNTEIFCTNCGASNGFTPDHVWVDADCVNPKTCTTCGATEGEALGHVWVDATYERPKTCAVCRVTEGEPLQQQPDTRTHLGVTYFEHLYSMEMLLADKGYGMNLLDETEEGYLVYEVLGTANESLGIQIHYELYDEEYVYGVMVITNNGKGENVANIVGFCMGAAWYSVDSSSYSEDMAALMGNTATGEDGSSVYVLDKNGLRLVLVISADETQIVAAMAPIE